MCIVAIVDANALSVLVSKQDVGDALFRQWINQRHGVLAFPPSGQFYNEIRNNKAVMALIKRYGEGGQLKKILPEELSDAGDQVNTKSYRSNDPHVLTLALASNATVLCSNDKNLCLDFKDKDILPPVEKHPRKVYPIDDKDRKRRKFLNTRRCPKRQRN